LKSSVLVFQLVRFLSASRHFFDYICTRASSEMVIRGANFAFAARVCVCISA